MAQRSDLSAPARSCVFCGGRPVSREHIWPDWIARALPGRVMVRHTRNLELEGQARAAHSYDAPLFGQRVRLVCAPCNNGWMSELEGTVKPFLETVLNGRGRQLHEGLQTSLAAWGFKTALMINGLFRDHSTGVPERHYRHLFETGAAPDDVAIWLSSIQTEAPAHIMTAGMAVSRPGERVGAADTPNIYTVTYSLGPLAVQVFGAVDPVGIRIDPRWGEYADPRVFRIWPYESVHTWTPVPGMTDAGFAQFGYAVFEELQRHVEATGRPSAAERRVEDHHTLGSAKRR